jgi:hypothetical protein
MDEDESKGHLEADLAAVRPPILRRVGLWRAIAGMAVAVALAALMVTIEIATQLSWRTHAMNRRIARLTADLKELRRVQSATQRKLGSARERASEGELFGRILFAPDLKLTKLVGTPESAGATGILAVSPSASAAMLGVSGLKPLDDGKVYRIWFLPRRGLARWVDDFLVNDDGKATVAVDFPQARSAQGTIIITLESQDYAEEPSGPIALKSVPAPEPHGRRK